MIMAHLCSDPDSRTTDIIKWMISDEWCFYYYGVKVQKDYKQKETPNSFSKIVTLSRLMVSVLLQNIEPKWPRVSVNAAGLNDCGAVNEGERHESIKY